MRKNKFTLIGLGTSVLLYFFVILLDFDLFEIIANAMWNLETYEIDEFLVPVIIFVIFLSINHLRNKRLYMVEAEKAKVYKAMIRANQHIFNNFLNKIEFYKLKTEETNGYSKEILMLFDQIVENTIEQVEALSKLDSINENSIINSYYPKIA